MTNSSPAPLSASSISIQKTDSPKPLVPNSQLLFGKTFTDHMLAIRWTHEGGWQTPEIKPYGNISLDPAALVLHYGLECFEGMKAYKGKNGEIRLFRPEMNLKRMNLSAKRLTLPAFDEAEFLKCIEQLLKIEERWIPQEKGYSLYLRPTFIATQPSLGVTSSNEALLYVICCPVGPYYPTGFKAVSLYATREYVRAWPGGTGNMKLGGNYAPGLVAQKLAADNECQQNLWIFGEEDKITEVGTMNLFVHLKTKEGETVLISPPLDGTILPGVTRYSILDLARQWDEFKVLEREITMHEVCEAVQEGRVIEMFGAGTACIVSPIKKILYDGKHIDIPLDPNNSEAQAGPLATRFFETILDIQGGDVKSEWSHVVQ
ncbi:branched-chain-amino-acid transaminase bat2 [Entomophthora muscae]|uniref:Branched-chain-amino-acid transaminase bat2 n=1 Tax=Entomophthora muscae TaxID=34485 RepID=A0ACC2TKB0_9FUNG|nr:branched-chain-amino-acid transaminase bat2 [Entomophthora muscae]